MPTIEMSAHDKGNHCQFKVTYRFHPTRVVQHHRLNLGFLMHSLSVLCATQAFLKLINDVNDGGVTLCF